MRELYIVLESCFYHVFVGCDKNGVMFSKA